MDRNRNNSMTATPDALTVHVQTILSIDIEKFPSNIRSPFGQEISLIDNEGRWLENIRFEHIGYLGKQIPWGDQFHKNLYIEWIFRSWVIEFLQLRIDVRSINYIAENLFKIEVYEINPSAVERAIFSWAVQSSEKWAAGRAFYSIRQMYEMCMDEGLPGFSEERLAELSDYQYWPKYRPDITVTLRDPYIGPFTLSELTLIERGLRLKTEISIRHLAMAYLCRDWGLRPIQLSLLRTTDFHEDELGPYILVPSVKGLHRARLRRAPSNMVKRYLSTEAAATVRDQCAVAERECVALRQQLQETIKSFNSAPSKIKTPLFPSKTDAISKAQRFCTTPTVLEYGFHAAAINISQEIVKLTTILRIPNFRDSNKSEDDIPFINISAYRFRRTKGTSMVLSGASPEEVAEALDHIGIASIKHYFRYNLDLHDYINRAHSSSSEIGLAVDLWSGSLVFAEESDPQLLKIANLGSCALSTPCPHHPTMSCYSCHKFRPSRDADHSQALRNMVSYRDNVVKSSTGPIAIQLDMAIQGAQSLITVLSLDNDSHDL